MAVRIRMKKMGRRHRPYYRICAMEQRVPRGGKVLEELGTYDPMVRDTDARAILNGERISYWLGVGAQPSDKVRVLIRKYGAGGTHLGEQRAALDRLAQPRQIPDPGTPASKPKSEAAPTEAPPAEEAPSIAATGEAAPAKESQEPASQEPAAEQPAEETAEKPEEASEEEKPSQEGAS